MQGQRSFVLALCLLLGAAEGTKTFFLAGNLKPSGDKAADEADAIAIGKIEKAEEGDEMDSKQMSAVAEIEEKKGKEEEAESREMEEDAAAIETAAGDTAKEEDQKAEKELEDVPADEKAAEEAASAEEALEDTDALHLKEVASKEELDAVHTEEDAARLRKDAEKIDDEAKVDVEAEQADVKTLEKAAKVEKKTGLAATETELKGRCGPQTKIHLPLTDDAASWSDPFPANKKHPIGRYDVKQAKICGPGTFTFSPTSCGRMDYKPDIFEVSNKESGDCKVVDLKWCSIGGLGCMMVDC